MQDRMSVMLTPRLPSSIKWVHIPSELKAQITAVFESAFKSKLKEVKWYVEGFIYPSETILRVGFGKKNQLKHHHYLLSWDTNQDSQLTAQVYQAIDYLDQIISEHITGVQTDLPRHWKPVKTQIKTNGCYFKYSTENLELEEMANQLLGEPKDQGLTQGNWDDLE